MRVMVIVKASKESEAGVLPNAEILTKMGKYNEQLVKAGVMLAGDGLKASSNGKRVRFVGENRTVIDGPFTETKEHLAGFYLVEANDLNEAIALAGKIPPVREGSIEVRPVRELDVG